ncbi:MAG: hypothetical protein IKV16_01035 [Clostridia bacterium]|nr:hypothetical protein [Clostridia bacterium]
MTLNDLKDEICALGFEREISFDKSLLFAIRRALSTVYTERSILSSFIIEHHPPTPSLLFKRLTHTPKSTEKFVIRGNGYSFTACGCGGYAVEENGVRREYAFTSSRYLLRGFIDGEATISFFGDCEFEIFNLAVFDRKRSDDENELFAYGEPFEYNLDRMIKDFYCIASLPTDENEKEIEGAIVHLSSLIIPWGYSGKIKIRYKVRPPEIRVDEPDSDIGLSHESEHLIALLAAAYYWADDAPEKTELYLAMYKDALRSARESDTLSLGGGYRNVTGWA